MKAASIVSAFFFLASFAYGQNPANAFKSTRQIVFGVAPFDGGKYVSSFITEDRKEIRLSAGFDHAVSVLLSDVYYWPIAAEYRADFQGVHLPLQGRLTVYQDKKEIKEIPISEYIYFFPYGQEGEATRLLYGKEKDLFIENYERAANELKSGKRADIPRGSFQGPFQGFILNLSAGQYRLVFSTEKDGRSFSIEKKLVVFDQVKAGITFQIIPEEKWTVSSVSETAHKGIYLKPGSLVFLKAFPAHLYNQADHELMVQPNRPSAGVGLSASYQWVLEEQSLEEGGNAFLVLEAAGMKKQMKPSEFLVKQSEGSALGYSIVEYDPKQHPSVKPTFSAYRLPAPPPGVGVRLSLEGIGKDTKRSLRSLDVGSANSAFFLLLLPLPLIALKRTLIFLERKRMKQFLENYKA